MLINKVMIILTLHKKQFVEGVPCKVGTDWMISKQIKIIENKCMGKILVTQ